MATSEDINLAIDNGSVILRLDPEFQSGRGERRLNHGLIPDRTGRQYEAEEDEKDAHPSAAE